MAAGPLTSTLELRDSCVRLRSARGLGKHPQGAIHASALAALHAGGNAHVQRRAGAALEWMGVEGARALAGQIGDENYLVSRYALEALVGLGVSGSDALEGRLEDPSARVREMAAEGLTLLGKDGCDRLVGWIHSDSADVRLSVIRAYSNHACLEARQGNSHFAPIEHAVSLSLRLDDTCEEICAEAARGLKAMGDVGAEATADRVKLASVEGQRKAIKVLQDMGTVGATALAKRLGDGTDVALRKRAALALRDMGADGASALATVLCASSTAAARWQAADTLGEMGALAEAHIATLRKSLSDESAWVRVSSTRALERLGLAALETCDDALSSLELCPGEGNALASMGAARSRRAHSSSTSSCPTRDGLVPSRRSRQRSGVARRETPRIF
eukprot:TRINITY_DN48972_c0_g1_i1.p1 TRINITY_DN48972_c0_g1~~TRINITY_DN48972_c0_g1_i1.p1  ORF type:complete len:420 (+),score=63.86 TRINITY_DN48972_c0_g1_i1:92-1261(+)